MKINTAVIAAAGFGSRMLPITKAIRKEMLPLLNKPLIEYIVEDCVKAGIKKIIFIVNSDDEQIPRYFTDQPVLKEYLKKLGKADKYEELKYLHEMADFEFIIQSDDAEVYGTAIPLKLAKEKVKEEQAFVYLGGDDFLYNKDGKSEVAKLMDYYARSGADALITCQAVSPALVSKYGVVDYYEAEGFKYMNKIVEKPEPGLIDSNLVNVTKWIFNQKVFKVLDEQKPCPEHGEYLITDTAQELISLGNKVAVYETKAEYIDFGYPEGWLRGNILYASTRKDAKYWVN